MTGATTVKYLGTKAPASILLCICFAGCASKEEKTAPLTADQSAAKSRLEAQMKEAAQTAQTYHAMDNATLLNHLVEQSKGLREPFNSLAYRELKTRTDVDPKALTAMVKENQNAGGLLPLLLLRKLDNKVYMEVTSETRAKVLTDALQASKTWLLGSSLGSPIGVPRRHSGPLLDALGGPHDIGLEHHDLWTACRPYLGIEVRGNSENGCLRGGHFGTASEKPLGIRAFL